MEILCFSKVSRKAQALRKVEHKKKIFISLAVRIRVGTFFPPTFSSPLIKRSQRDALRRRTSIRLKFTHKRK